MQSSFWIAASGLNIHQRALDVVANNVSNANTIGFKGSQVRFEDVIAQTVKLGGGPELDSASTVNPVQRGQGVTLAAISKNFADGTVEPTGQPADLAIQGQGLFVLQPPDDAQEAVFYSRAGHFELDAQVANPGVSAAGPVRFVTSQGYALQGVVATVDAVTGQYVLPAGNPAAGSLVDVEFDPAATFGPFATTSIGFSLNVDAVQPLAIDPIVMEMNDQGVDRTVRIEFQRASADGLNFFFTVQNPTPDPVTLAFTTENDGITGTPITGIIRLDQNGNVAGVFENTDADRFLTAAEAAALTPWANVDGLGRPIFTVGAAPAAAVVDESPYTLTAPAAFNLAGAPDAGSLNMTIGGETLVENVDYTIAANVVTPITGWFAGTLTANYTTGGGVTNASEQFAIANVQPVQSFQVANFPIVPGTQVIGNANPGAPPAFINGSRGGAALVEGTDYTIDDNTGIVTPLTFWDADGTPLMIDYTPADTRITVTHNITGSPMAFTHNEALGSSGSVNPEVRPREDVIVGAATSVIDDQDNEHSLGFTMERLSANRWYWTATPTYRSTLADTDVIDSATGGGTGLDGINVLPNTLINLGNGRYDITIRVDEGNGAVDFLQVPQGAAFPASGGISNYFQVVDPVTGEIAFSRDLDNVTSPTDFEIFTTYKSAIVEGEGILAFDEDGLYDAVNSTILTAIDFTPQNATALAITPDFTQLTQYGRQSDVAVINNDGFRAGTLEEWNFDNQGRIVGLFTNGLQQYLAQVAIARFPNPQGLLSRGENAFVESVAAGTVTLHLAGPSSDIGTLIVPEALETSNIEMNEEITNMIIFQKAYQFNSRIITTTDEMLQEAIRMKR